MLLNIQGPTHTSNVLSNPTVLKIMYSPLSNHLLQCPSFLHISIEVWILWPWQNSITGSILQNLPHETIVLSNIYCDTLNNLAPSKPPITIMIPKPSYLLSSFTFSFLLLLRIKSPKSSSFDEFFPSYYQPMSYLPTNLASEKAIPPYNYALTW